MHNMETCKTCKFWSDRYEPKKGIADCDRVGGTTKDPLKAFDIEVTVDDDSGMNFELMTGENFGCVLHEPKVKVY